MKKRRSNQKYTERKNVPTVDNCNKKQKKNKYMHKWPWGIIFVALTAFILVAVIWYALNIGEVSFEQLLFHIRVPIETTGFNPLKSFGPAALICALLAAMLYYILFKRVLVKKRVKVRNTLLVVVGIFILVVVIALAQLGLFTYIKNIRYESPAWRESYVDPEEVELTFPDDKRNVIYIVLESMETTYADKETGGAMPQNLIPNLSKLALNDDNISFSHNKRLGGPRMFAPLAWTASSLVGQMGGIPLKLPVSDANAFDAANDEYLPGAVMIGDILQEEGYYLEMMMGSSSRFASRDDLYKEHGDFVMTDYNKLAKDGYIPIINGKYQFEFWGINDRRLFEIAKERLLDISQQDSPFFFSLLTVDTHFPEGYQYKDRERLHTNNYANSILWSDRDVYDFVCWCQEQEFYENTTIILLGDHLSMDDVFFRDVPPEYPRRMYNVILNSAIDTAKSRQYMRRCCVMDFYPTTLAAMGVDIEGDRLAYGTNLFSDKETLCEIMGEAAMTEMLDSSSHFYNDKFLYNKNDE